MNIFDIQQEITIENFIIIWLDANQKFYDTDITSTLIRLQKLVNLIKLFSDCDQCIDFISDIKYEKIFFIVSDSFGQQIIPLIINLNQIDSIYIYSKDKNKNEKWILNEKKIKGICTRIETIYDLLRRDLRQCEDDLIPFNILSSTYQHFFNHSDQLFICTQLMKEILLELKYQPENSKLDIIEFCSLKYQNNNYQLDLIKKFQNYKNPSASLRWYTNESFIYSILNKAFRIQDMNMLIKMNSFIQDLYKEIQREYTKSNKQNSSLIVYRGQGISEEIFQKLIENQNGFLSFNNFLITTTDKNLSLAYARFARDNHELKGILFHIEIDSTISLLTSWNKISYYSESNEEILFLTHTIFRIHDIQEIENNLLQIQLKLTINEIEELKALKKFVRKEIEGKNDSERLEILRTKLQIIMDDELQITNQIQDTKMEIEDSIENTTEEQFTDSLQISLD